MGVPARRHRPRAARRSRAACPLEWSHDTQWVLVQDGGERVHDAARRAASTNAGGLHRVRRSSSDGRWSLVLGNRDGVKAPDKKPDKKSASKKGGKAARAEEREDREEARAEAGAPQGGGAGAADRRGGHRRARGRGRVGRRGERRRNRAPTGPLALYRGRLEGAFTDAPTLLVKIVDGAAVWVPAKP